MKRREILIGAVVLALTLGFAAGAGLDAARAETPAAMLDLGSSAADVVAKDGHPVKITWGPEVQTWHYTEQNGALRARYEINQGLVVRILHEK